MASYANQGAIVEILLQLLCSSHCVYYRCEPSPQVRPQSSAPHLLLRHITIIVRGDLHQPSRFAVLIRIPLYTNSTGDQNVQELSLQEFLRFATLQARPRSFVTSTQDGSPSKPVCEFQSGSFPNRKFRFSKSIQHCIS